MCKVSKKRLIGGQFTRLALLHLAAPPPPTASPRFTHCTLLLMQFQLRLLSIFEYVSAFHFDLQSTFRYPIPIFTNSTHIFRPPIHLISIKLSCHWRWRFPTCRKCSFQYSRWPLFSLPPKDFPKVYSLVLLLSTAAAASSHLIVFLRFSFCDFLFDFGPELLHLTTYILWRRGKAVFPSSWMWGRCGSAMLLMMLTWSWLRGQKYSSQKCSSSSKTYEKI